MRLALFKVLTITATALPACYKYGRTTTGQPVTLVTEVPTRCQSLGYAKALSEAQGTRIAARRGGDTVLWDTMHYRASVFRCDMSPDTATPKKYSGNIDAHPHSLQQSTSSLNQAAVPELNEAMYSRCESACVLDFEEVHLDKTCRKITSNIIQRVQSNVDEHICIMRMLLDVKSEIDGFEKAYAAVVVEHELPKTENPKSFTGLLKVMLSSEQRGYIEYLQANKQHLNPNNQE